MAGGTVGGEPLAEALGLLGPAAGRVGAIVGAGGKTTLLHRLAAELGGRERVLVTTTTRIFAPELDRIDALLLVERQEEIEALLSRGFPDGPGRLLVGRELTRDLKLEGIPPRWVDRIAGGGWADRMLIEADGAGQRSLKAQASHEFQVPACADWIVAVAALDVIGRPLAPEWVHRAPLVSEWAGAPLGAEVTPVTVARTLAMTLRLFANRHPAARRIALLNKCEGARAVRNAREVEALLPAESAERVVAGSLQGGGPPLLLRAP